MSYKRSRPFGGRIYWTEKQVRVWLNNGHWIDLGPRSLESARVVAANLEMELVVQGVPGPVLAKQQ